jgi:hypothetical protein
MENSMNDNEDGLSHKVVGVPASNASQDAERSQYPITSNSTTK